MVQRRKCGFVLTSFRTNRRNGRKTDFMHFLLALIRMLFLFHLFDIKYGMNVSFFSLRNKMWNHMKMIFYPNLGCYWKDRICATKCLKTDVCYHVKTAWSLWVTCQVYAECVNITSDICVHWECSRMSFDYAGGFCSNPGMFQRPHVVTSPSSVRLPRAVMMTKTKYSPHDLLLFQ